MAIFFHGFNRAALKAGIQNPESGIRIPEKRNHKPELSTIRENYNNLPTPSKLCYNPRGSEQLRVTTSKYD